MLPCRKNLRQIGLIRSTYDQSKIGSFKKLTFSLEADEESRKSSKNVDFYLWSIGKTLNSYHTFVIVWFSHFESPVLCSGPDTADTPLDYFLLAKNPYKKNVHTKKCTYTFRNINCIWSTMRVQIFICNINKISHKTPLCHFLTGTIYIGGGQKS